MNYRRWFWVVLLALGALSVLGRAVAAENSIKVDGTLSGYLRLFSADQLELKIFKNGVVNSLTTRAGDIVMTDYHGLNIQTWGGTSLLQRSDYKCLPVSIEKGDSQVVVKYNTLYFEGKEGESTLHTEIVFSAAKLHVKETLVANNPLERKMVFSALLPVPLFAGTVIHFDNGETVDIPQLSDLKEGSIFDRTSVKGFSFVTKAYKGSMTVLSPVNNLVRLWFVSPNELHFQLITEPLTQEEKEATIEFELEIQSQLAL